MMGIFQSQYTIAVFVLLLCAGEIRAASGNNQDLLPSDCGTSVAIGDGTNAENQPSVGSYPWMAILRYNSSNGFQDACVGSLISKRYVLAAGHCLKNPRVKLHSVILGEFDKSQNPDCNDKHDTDGVELERTCVGPFEEFEVESVTVHPEYNQPRHRNDIGVVRLNRDVTMKDHIQPVCLPVTSELRDQNLETYVVTSWKRSQDETQTDLNRLHKAVVRRVNSAECQQKFAKTRVELGEQQLCTEASDVICMGSGGAPLGNTDGARFVQFGLDSFGSTLCGNAAVPEVYTRVASYMDWILSTIEP